MRYQVMLLACVGLSSQVLAQRQDLGQGKGIYLALDETEAFDEDAGEGHWDMAAMDFPEFDLGFDTRCNPANKLEIQKFTGKNWEHHFTCSPADKCIDVNGHGGCKGPRVIYIPSYKAKRALPPSFPKRPTTTGMKQRRDSMRIRRQASSAAAPYPSTIDGMEVVVVDENGVQYSTATQAQPAPTPMPALSNEPPRDGCDGSWVGVHRCNPQTNVFERCVGSHKSGGYWKANGDCHGAGGFCVQKGKGQHQQAWCQLMDFEDDDY